MHLEAVGARDLVDVAADGEGEDEHEGQQRQPRGRLAIGEERALGFEDDTCSHGHERAVLDPAEVGEALVVRADEEAEREVDRSQPEERGVALVLADRADRRCEEPERGEGQGVDGRQPQRVGQERDEGEEADH